MTLDKREAASLTVNERESYRDRLIFLTQREILARRLWAKIGLKKPHPKQQLIIDAWLNGAQYLHVNAGRRSAKTVTGSLFALPELCFKPPGILPQRLVLHTGPEFDVTDRIGKYLWDWIIKDQIYGFVPKPASDRERFIELPWRARLEGKTTREPTSLLGDGIVGTLSDEHARNKPEILPQYYLPPLADTGGWLMNMTTPRGRLNHSYDTHMDWKERMESGDPRYFAIQMTSYDNPYVDHQVFEDFRLYCVRTGQEDLYAQEILAEYTSLAGSIYKRFQPTRNGMDWHVGKVDYIPGVPISLGLDWGTDHPFVCVFGQVVDGDRLQVFDMISETGLDPVQQVERVLDRLDGRYVDLAYCDPSGLGNKLLFENNGIYVFKPSATLRSKLNDVNGGITEVNKLWARNNVPACQIDTKCVKLITGLQTYHWDKGEKPEKVADDECDAFRYLVMGTMGLYVKPPDIFFV